MPSYGEYNYRSHACASACPEEVRFKALQKDWVQTSRDFAKLNDLCATADPSGSSADKGRRYLDLVCNRISQFLIELATTPIDDHFPYKP